MIVCCTSCVSGSTGVLLDVSSRVLLGIADLSCCLASRTRPCLGLCLGLRRVQYLAQFCWFVLLLCYMFCRLSVFYVFALMDAFVARLTDAKAER